MNIKSSLLCSPSGNINNTTEIESIMDKDYMCSRVVGLVGEPFSIETTSDFTEATLTFKVDKTKLGDTEFDNSITARSRLTCPIFRVHT